MQESDITKMKVADLKRELKLRGLTVIGNKTELMERLQAALIDGVEGDELLDETVLTDEDESNILDDENDLLQSPKLLKMNVRGSKDEDDLLLSPTANGPKKVVLKRKSSFKELEEIAISKENTKPISEQIKILKMSERNPIKVSSHDEENKTETNSASGNVKVSQLTAKERLEMRAKKFGQGGTTVSAGSISSSLPVGDDQIEKLKKRAERFGVVSPAIAKLDEKEKLLKRKERFGGTESTGSGTTVATGEKGNDVWAQKARQRLERFKTITPTTTSVEK